jgi:hypothetical protein
MLHWGKYLARGIHDSANIEDNNAKLFQKIERVLQRKWCLCPFSSKIAVQFLQSRLSRDGGSDRLKRVVNLILDMVNETKKTQRSINEAQLDWQSGCPNIVRGLRAIPIWDTAQFPWIKDLEAACPSILSELMSLKVIDMRMNMFVCEVIQ